MVFGGDDAQRDRDIHMDSCEFRKIRIERDALLLQLSESEKAHRETSELWLKEEREHEATKRLNGEYKAALIKATSMIYDLVHMSGGCDCNVPNHRCGKNQRLEDLAELRAVLKCAPDCMCEGCQVKLSDTPEKRKDEGRRVCWFAEVNQESKAACSVCKDVSWPRWYGDDDNLTNDPHHAKQFACREDCLKFCTSGRPSHWHLCPTEHVFVA